MRKVLIKKYPKITQNKIALDFSAKVKKQLAETVSSVLQKNDQLESFVKADPTILKKYRLFIFPKSSSSRNKHIFVRAMRVCFL